MVNKEKSRLRKKNESQDGGTLTSIVFPLGKTLGYMTMGLMRVNEMFQENYRRKHGDFKHKPKLNKLNLTDKKSKK
jgi:hypothetical protein